RAAGRDEAEAHRGEAARELHDASLVGHRQQGPRGAVGSGGALARHTYVWPMRTLYIGWGGGAEATLKRRVRLERGGASPPSGSAAATSCWSRCGATTRRNCGPRRASATCGAT